VEAATPNPPPVESQPQEPVQGLVEDEPGQPEPVVDEIKVEPIDDGYPTEDPPTDPKEPGADLEADVPLAAGDQPAGDDPGLNPEVTEWREKFEHAEEMRGNMERDYRQKTQKMAVTRRELKTNLEEVAAQGQFFLNLAEQGVKQFDQVNWQELQARPEEYNRARMGFQTALQGRDQMHKALQNVHATMAETREAGASQEAEVSRDILRSMDPKWGPEAYQTLRAHAVEHLDYSGEEMDQITDWRLIRLLQRDLATHVSVETVVKVRSKPGNGKAPAGVRNLAQPQRKNAKGNYQNSRAEAHERPGHRPSFRAMMEDKLRAEREATRL